MTFPAAVNLGRRLKFWNTNPIRLLRIPAQLIVIQSPDLDRRTDSRPTWASPDSR